MADRENIERLRRQIESETKRERAKRLAKAEQDPDRPRYHYQPPPAWMNDPNGPFFWKGEYHVFYQYNPDKPYHADMHWGHAASEDLVHWRHLPIALAPTPGGPDKGGCWTGCTVDNNGVPTIMYTGVHPQAQCIATSVDDDMLIWEKYEGNPVISAPPPGLTVTGFRDPCAWKEGDTWYVIIGSGIEGIGGTSLLYRSSDLIHWEYMHPLYECDPEHKMHECPDFFPLGDKHILITSPYDGTHWTVGTYAHHKFTPEKRGKIDWNNTYYAAKTTNGDLDRCIIWGWIREERSVEEQIKAGWSGVLSLPRILTLSPDKTLRIEPAPELEMLRGQHWSFENMELASSDELSLEDIQSDCVEVMAQFSPNDAQTFGIVVQGTNAIAYDREKQQLAGAPLELTSDDELVLHVYVDRSVTEIFANGRVCRTMRVYKGDADESGISIFANGGSAKLKSIDVWKLGY